MYCIRDDAVFDLMKTNSADIKSHIEQFHLKSFGSGLAVSTVGVSEIRTMHIDVVHTVHCL